MQPGNHNAFTTLTSVVAHMQYILMCVVLRDAFLITAAVKSADQTHCSPLGSPEPAWLCTMIEVLL